MGNLSLNKNKQNYFKSSIFKQQIKIHSLNIGDYKMKTQILKTAFLISIFCFMAIASSAELSGEIDKVENSNGDEVTVDSTLRRAEVYTIKFSGEDIKDFHIKLNAASASVKYHTGEMPTNPSDSTIDVFVGSFIKGGSYTRTIAGGTKEKFMSFYTEDGDPITDGEIEIRFNSGTPGWKQGATFVIFTSDGNINPFNHDTFYKSWDAVPTLCSVNPNDPCDEAVIPTLSEWGVIILLLLMVAMGMVFLYQRQTSLAVAGVTVSQTMGVKPKLFDRNLFAKVFAIVLLIGVAGLVAAYLYFGQITNADPFGVFVSTAVVAYMVHLWLMKKEGRS